MLISVAVQSHEKGTETTCTKTWLCGKVCAKLLLITDAFVRPAWQNPDLTLQTDLSLEQLTSHPSVI